MNKAKGSAFPEFLERGDRDAGAWDVRGSIVPRTNIDKRTMDVPLGTDAHSRAIRAKELMRAKVSPPKLIVPDDWRGSSTPIPPEILDACEDVRINALNRIVGNNPDDMDFGGVTNAVDRAIRADDVNSLVQIIVRATGTKAQNSVARAVRVSSKKHGKPEFNDFAKQLRVTVRNNSGYFNEAHYKNNLADTDPYRVNVDGVETTIPYGYRHTLSLAEAVNSFLRRRQHAIDGDPTLPDKGKVPEVTDMPESFAPLSLLKLPLTERVAGRMGRKRSATNMGINPRRIHRYFVDPEKRIFDKRIKGIGGVVLIDQSGSMSLSTDEIWEIIKASPGCTIIGYSHGHESPYNCWVLAENGKVVSEVIDGNGGNGVDGPALLFALSKRKEKDPLIWVCDGYVTGNGDCHTDKLANWCAKVVAKYKVHMVPDVEEAVAALKQVRDGRKLPVRATGPVLNAIERMIGRGEFA